MSSYYLILDESGGFEQNNRYIIIGGLLIKSDTKEKSILADFVNNIKQLLKIEELHSYDLNNSDKPVIRGAIFSKIKFLREIRAIAYVFDLKNTAIFKQYDKTPCNCCRKTFKYNKAISLLYRDLIRHNILDEDDEVNIILDKLDLNNKEQQNIRNWLHESFSNIKGVELQDSRDNIFIQIADLIVNSYPKTSKYIPERIEFKLLDPFFEVFPKAYKEEYYF